MRFRDRADAGRQLARRLQQERMEAPVVVGLPRGGVPVAAEVARALGAPLDVLVVRKLGCPWQPEFALGAVGEEDAIVLNQPLIASIGLPPHDLANVIRAERAELARRVARFYDDFSQTGDEEVTRLLPMLEPASSMAGATDGDDDPSISAPVTAGSPGS